MAIITINLDQRHLDWLALVEQERKIEQPALAPYQLRSQIIREILDNAISTHDAHKEATPNDHRD